MVKADVRPSSHGRSWEVAKPWRSQSHTRLSLFSCSATSRVHLELDGHMLTMNQLFNIDLLKFPHTSLSITDSIYRDAKHYWPLDHLNITVKNAEITRNDIRARTHVSGEYWSIQTNKGVKDSKTGLEGLVFSDCVTSKGVVNQSVETDGKGAWLNLGSFVNTCMSEPSLCAYGLTVSLWTKYAVLDSNGLQYFMGTSGSKEGLRGFLIYQDFSYDSEDHLTVKVENGTMVWKRSFAVPRESWTHVTFTWDQRDGLAIYTNGSFVGEDPKGKTTKPEAHNFTTLTLGRPNDDRVFSKAAFDEIAIWEKKLHPTEIEAVYKRTAKVGMGPDLEKGNQWNIFFSFH